MERLEIMAAIRDEIVRRCIPARLEHPGYIAIHLPDPGKEGGNEIQFGIINGPWSYNVVDAEDQYEMHEGETSTIPGDCEDVARVANWIEKVYREWLEDTSDAPEHGLLRLTREQMVALAWVLDVARSRVNVSADATEYEFDEGKDLYRFRAAKCRVVATLTPFPGDNESWEEAAVEYDKLASGKVRA